MKEKVGMEFFTRYDWNLSEAEAEFGVIFPASVQQKVKDCITNIKTKIGIPLSVPLHWRKHCHLHESRKFVASEISKIEGLAVIYVISDKKSMPVDHEKFYNIVAAFKR